MSTPVEKINEWYRAAQQGDAAAQYRLGLCYYSGDGVGQDYAQAAGWFKRAADSGYTLGQSMIGYCYYIGQGVASDFNQAAAYFTKAVEGGEASAMCNLGICYLNGHGVKQDFSKAADLFKRSADLGYEYAKTYLEYCRKNNIGSAPDSASDAAASLEAEEEEPVQTYSGSSYAARQNGYGSGPACTGDNPGYPQIIVGTQNSKQDFLRRAWIKLAEEGAPLDAFRCDCSEVVEREQVYLRSDFKVSLSYTATVGHNYTETYTDYEERTVQEPYTYTGQKYVSGTSVDVRDSYGNTVGHASTPGHYESYSETRYREKTVKVPVTKTRTRTNWSPFGGSGVLDCTAFASVTEDPWVDAGTFKNQLGRMPDSNLHILTPREYHDVRVDASALGELASQENQARSSESMDYAKNELNRNSGIDSWKGLSVNSSKISGTYTLYFAKAYSVTFNYWGHRYTKTGSAFGDMNVHGNWIHDDSNWDSEVHKLEDNISKMKSDQGDCWWEKYCEFRRRSFLAGGIPLIVAMIVLIGAIGFAIAANVMEMGEDLIYIAGTVLIAAICFVVLTVIMALISSKIIASRKRDEYEIVRDRVEYNESRINARIDAIRASHKKEILNALNAKLARLGLRAASESELHMNWE